MKKVILGLLLVFALTGCKLNKEVEFEYNLLAGQDTVEINTTWVDAGVEITFDGASTTVTSSDNVDTTTLGLYKVEYTAEFEEEDYIVVRYVVVVDNTVPVITLSEGLDTISIGDIWVDAGVIVLDNSLGTVTITVDGSVDNNVIGRYVVTYTVVDSSGNESVVQRIINVVN